MDARWSSLAQPASAHATIRSLAFSILVVVFLCSLPSPPRCQSHTLSTVSSSSSSSSSGFVSPFSVRSAGVDAWKHYVSNGFKEGRQIAVTGGGTGKFNAAKYLKINPVRRTDQPRRRRASDALLLSTCGPDRDGRVAGFGRFSPLLLPHAAAAQPAVVGAHGD